MRHLVLGVSDSYAQDYTVTVPDSPYADITHRALAVLEPIVLEEFSHATS